MAGVEVRRSRRELEDLVNDQRDQLLKYDSRLRDVIQAYKGLSKEKAALHRTVAALGERDGDDKNTDVETLAAAVKTLTAEKSKLETAFQEDRKKLRAEKQRLESETATLAKDKEDVKKELEDVKSKLIVERHQRDKDTDNSALIMREFQKLVAEERRSKEELESRLQQTLKELAHNAKCIPSKDTEKRDDFDETQQKLNAKIAAEEEKLRISDEKRAADIDELRRELEESRRQEQITLARAKERALQAETLHEETRKEQETRVANLEVRLQELSVSVGNYDRLRQDDQSLIFRLKERVHQLESEKSATSSPNPENCNFCPNCDDESNLDAQWLSGRKMQLKTLLREAGEKSENPVDLDSDLCTEQDSDSLVDHWKKLCRHLRDEVESLKKTPFNVPTPSRAIRVADKDEEISRLKKEVAVLKAAMADASRKGEEYRAMMAELNRKELKLKSTILQMETESKEHQNAAETNLKNRLIQLEAELVKQRDRCLTIIDEKEDEVSMLKSSMEATLEAAFRATCSTLKSDSPDSKQLMGAAAASIVNSVSSGHGRTSKTRRRTESAADSVADELTATSTQQAEGMVLFYEEELAHRETELAALREKAREYESTMRDLQMRFVGKEERYLDDIDSLRDRIDTLQRMSTKEGANLEYLKNVVLTYMLSSDASSREHILKAIAAVLTFSKDELTKVRDYNASWFRWGSTQAEKKHQTQLFSGGGAPT